MGIVPMRALAALGAVAFVACTFDYDALLDGAGGATTSGAATTATSTGSSGASSSTGPGGAPPTSNASTASGSGSSTTTSSGGGGDGGSGGSGGGPATSSAQGNGGTGGEGGGPPEPVARHCREIVGTPADVGDGPYRIDPDGPGGVEPYFVRCDMTTDGGGWTRFNWLEQDFPAGADPLEQALQDCGVDDLICRGRIPSVIQPTHILVKDLTDDADAAWELDGSEVSNAMLAALRDKQEVCVGPNGSSFNPYLDTSKEPFCGTAGECDSFKYGDNGCGGIMDWVVTLDDDSHYCRAAFKLGRATGVGNCGDVDWGFLDDCDCSDEHGALYFR